MKCPNCKKDIDSVNVYSECYQRADIKGSKITEYGSVEEVLETKGIECPQCSHDLIKLITQ